MKMDQEDQDKLTLNEMKVEVLKSAITKKHKDAQVFGILLLLWHNSRCRSRLASTTSRHDFQRLIYYHSMIVSPTYGGTFHSGLGPMTSSLDTDGAILVRYSQIRSPSCGMASNVDEEASAEPVPKSNCGAGQVAVGVQSSSVRLGALPLTGISTGIRCT